jgi:hypothetical protein
VPECAVKDNGDRYRVDRKPRDRVLPHCWPIPRNDRFQAIFQIKPSLGAARGLEGNAQSRLWAAADAVAVDQTNVGVNKIIHVVRWLPPDPNDKSPAIEPEPDRVPGIAEALMALKVKSVTLDGEAVVCGPDGVTDFDRLRAAMGREGSRQAFLYAFEPTVVANGALTGE